MIKLEHLRYFATVAESGNLLEAARRLHRTPSAVSMTLKQLELQLGGSLFEGDRKHHLTPLGVYVQQQSAQLLHEYQRFLGDVRLVSLGESGKVCIATVPTVAALFLPKVLRDFSVMHPKLRLEVHDLDSANVADMVIAKRADFGIASVLHPSDDLQVEWLSTERFMCVCRSDHSLAMSGRSIGWSSLADHTFISNGLCQQISIPEARKIIDSAQLSFLNIISLLAFVESGFGVTLLPKIVQALAPSLCFLPLEDDRVVRKLMVLRPANRTLSPASEKLVELLRETLTHSD